MFRCSTAGLAILLATTASSGGRNSPLDSAGSEVQQTSGAESLGPDGKALLKTTLDAGTLSDLRWPDFSDRQGDAVRFYEAYGDALPWEHDKGPTAQARAMIAVLQSATDKGLSPEDYDSSRWAGRLARLRPATPQPAEQDLVRFDVALTISAMRYISALHVGRVNPQRLDFAVDVSRRRYDLPQFLEDNVVQAANVPAALQQIEPPYPGYQRTIQALERYRGMALRDDGERLPEFRKPVKTGDSYAGVPRLTRLLRLLGDLPPDAVVDPNSTVYGAPLVGAVKSFQARHGLPPDGRIDSATLAQLNVPLTRRVQQMELTLERWRWLPDEYRNSPIVVNVPEFRLRAYDEDFKIAVTMKVVVGRAYEHKTPIFMARMTSVVFRPYWNVPLSIATAEVIPEMEKNPSYLTKQNMDIVDDRGNVVSSEVVSEEMLQAIRDGKLSLRQRPGPENSLGLIKFLFPNEYDVYMHDTPATELFSQSRRDFSHGCIRLEKPVDLAVWVLRTNPGWDVDRIRAAMNGDETQEVKLARPIPVLIVYGTAIVSEDGIVHFFNDIYKHDAALGRALAKGYPYPH